MKKNQLLLKKSRWSFLTILILFTISVTILSCNNDKKGAGEEKKEQDKSVSPGDAAAAAPAATTLDNFPILYIEFQKITDAFNVLPPGQIRKMVFVFHFDGGATNGQPTLSGFPARQTGIFTSTTPFLTLSKSSLSIKLNYPLYLGNIELTRDEYNTLYNDASKKTYIAFIPKISTPYPNVVTYTTSWATSVPLVEKDLKSIKISVIGDELNPSPPKNSY